MCMLPQNSQYREAKWPMGEKETCAACFLFGDGCSPSGGERLPWEADAFFEEQH